MSPLALASSTDHSLAADPSDWGDRIADHSRPTRGRPNPGWVLRAREDETGSATPPLITRAAECKTPKGIRDNGSERPDILICAVLPWAAGGDSLTLEVVQARLLVGRTCWGHGSD